MGTLLAASLARAGEAVTLLDHDPARAARLDAHPLVVTTLAGESWMAPVPVVTRAPEHVEVAFLCVKASATEAALDHVRAQTCTLAVVQNGCERAEFAGSQTTHPERVVGVSTSVGASLKAEGHALHAGSGKTHVGPLFPEGAERATRVVELLSAAGWAAEGGDVRALSWRKLVVNAAINALTGLLDCPNGHLLTSPAASDLADEAAREVARVAQARGISGDWDPAAACLAWREVALHTSANISSTVQDLRRGQTTEVHAINGAVARLAAEEGLAAPTNELLCRLVAARQELAVLGAERDGPEATD